MYTDKKRVLIIAANDMGISGVPGVFMSIVRLLHDYFIFDIVITRDNYYHKNEFLSFGGNIYNIFEKNHSNKCRRIWYKLFEQNSEIKKKLNIIINSTHYDIIHSFKEDWSGIFFKVAKKQHINKRILHINRTYFKQSGLIGLYIKRRHKQSIRLATHHIAVSNQAGKSYYGSISFQTIYNTYDERLYKYTENKSTDLVLTQIGTFIPLKNQFFTIKVFGKIQKRFPNSQLNLVGSIHDTNYYKDCVEYINKNNISNVNFFSNNNTDLRGITSHSTATLLPSINEGLSIVAIESQAQGIHIFASTGVPKEVDCGNMMFLELDENIWTETIFKYYKSHGNERCKTNMERFSNDTFVNSLLKIYN